MSDNNSIKKDFKDHLEKTFKKIKSHDGWDLVDIPLISENELLSVAKAHGLENDSQTRTFCKFIAIGTNFASLDFQSRLQEIPEMVITIKDLLSKMEQEIKEFSDIANFFSTLIQSFIKLVINTQHNLKMALPHLEEAIVHMNVMSEALSPESEKELDEEDLLDIDLALSNMSNGISKLLEHSKSSRNESIELDGKITNLKENIENKITIVENRIGFGNLLPKVGASLGMITGASATTAAVESIAFGGTGVLVLGGLSFPPLGAILLGASVGAFGIGSLLLLMIKLWEKHQYKALEYLRLILDKLNKLNSANLSFMGYMNRSEENAHKILTNMEFFKRNVKNSSPRYRKINAAVSSKAAQSTNEIIETIYKIDQIDLSKWCNHHIELFSLENEQNYCK
ncbi:hypothetical protein BpHYR1_005449 [Brachionus plicatilis]|uniref:Uncharacterized protein n=1 Tax=Brachionus plicatilis TaxID=10195 RepID=A0A3M7S2U0_BRAPC|nr:hypothetical protein BpHYR1_005449 [Brachionus plicatilis]